MAERNIRSSVPMEDESKDPRRRPLPSIPARNCRGWKWNLVRMMRPWLFDPDHGSYSRRHNVIIVQLVVGHRRRIGMSGQYEVLKLDQTTRVYQLCVDELILTGTASSIKGLFRRSSIRVSSECRNTRCSVPLDDESNDHRGYHPWEKTSISSSSSFGTWLTSFSQARSRHDHAVANGED